jgi:hypothetical protein
VPELLGHRDVRTTMIYTHVLNRGGLTTIGSLTRACNRRRRAGGPQRREPRVRAFAAEPQAVRRPVRHAGRY